MSTEATLRKNTQVVGNSMESQVVRPGERTNSEGKPTTNAILLAIPDEEFAMIRDGLNYLDLPHYTVLHEPRRKLEYAYVLNSGMASVVFNTNHRESVEVGVIGNEGFAPIPVAAGIRHSPHEAIMQVSGDGFQLPVDNLQAALKASPQLQKLLSRYATVHGIQAAQTAGCNRLHDLEQRLARWLLLIQDRVGSGLLSITHEFLATMLGTDRPSGPGNWCCTWFRQSHLTGDGSRRGRRRTRPAGRERRRRPGRSDRSYGSTCSTVADRRRTTRSDISVG